MEGASRTRRNEAFMREFQRTEPARNVTWLRPVPADGSEHREPLRHLLDNRGVQPRLRRPRCVHRFRQNDYSDEPRTAGVPDLTGGQAHTAPAVLVLTWHVGAPNDTQWRAEPGASRVRNCVPCAERPVPTCAVRRSMNSAQRWRSVRAFCSRTRMSIGCSLAVKSARDRDRNTGWRPLRLRSPRPRSSAASPGVGDNPDVDRSPRPLIDAHPRSPSAP
jgi:hypothetical protein